MSSRASGNNKQNVRKSGSLGSRSSSGHTSVKHSAVNNPVPGKGGNGSDKGGKK